MAHLPPPESPTSLERSPTSFSQSKEAIHQRPSPRFSEHRLSDDDVPDFDQRLPVPSRLPGANWRSDWHVKTGAGEHAENQDEEIFGTRNPREILQGPKDTGGSEKEGGIVYIEDMREGEKTFTSLSLAERKISDSGFTVLTGAETKDIHVVEVAMCKFVLKPKPQTSNDKVEAVG